MVLAGGPALLLSLLLINVTRVPLVSLEEMSGNMSKVFFFFFLHHCTFIPFFMSVCFVHCVYYFVQTLLGVCVAPCTETQLLT